MINRSRIKEPIHEAPTLSAAAMAHNKLNRGEPMIKMGDRGEHAFRTAPLPTRMKVMCARCNVLQHVWAVTIGGAVRRATVECGCG